MWDLEKFKSAVAPLCNDRYELEDGRVVAGQSISFLRQCLYLDDWKGISGWRIDKPLEEAGFEVSRGRGMRWYRGGKRGLGVRCEVVHCNKVWVE